MLRRYLNLLYGLSCNWIGRLGIALTTAAFVTFVLLEIPRLLGVLTNAYLGLITYLLLPVIFVLGLLLIPFGWQRYCRSSGRTTAELLAERFAADDVAARPLGSRAFLTVAALTLVNILFLGVASVRTLQFMDQPAFCGTACHSVMNPEWVTYQQSPHARVRCVDCHVGEGAGALIDSKLNGAYQLLSISLDLYERPIPTPVHQLRPARETCETCHWPEKFYGRRLKTLVRHRSDSLSTPRYTTLSMKVDTGTRPGVGGIHWHVGGHNQVRYASVDDERERMSWVEVLRADGTRERYEDRALLSGSGRSGRTRTMDCVDCHNRATHIYENPAHGLDARLQSGRISRTLPYIRREALSALTYRYPAGEATAGIDQRLRTFYSRTYPLRSGRWRSRIDSAVSVLQEMYARNVHPGMGIAWGSYPSHLGHEAGGGCFRCHNPQMRNAAGRSVNHDCTVCHSILADESAVPFQYLRPSPADSAEAPKHRFLQHEFLQSLP